MGKIYIKNKLVDEDEYNDYLDTFIFLLDYFKHYQKLTDRASKKESIMDSFLLFDKKYKIVKR